MHVTMFSDEALDVLWKSSIAVDHDNTSWTSDIRLRSGSDVVFGGTIRWWHSDSSAFRLVQLDGSTGGILFDYVPLEHPTDPHVKEFGTIVSPDSSKFMHYYVNSKNSDDRDSNRSISI